MPLTVNRFLRLGKRTSIEKCNAVLEEVGAPNIANTQLAEISGGEMRRVLLARALLRNPDLLVLDEPLASVDVAGQAELYQLIAQIRNQRGCGILLVSHDLHFVMAATDTVVCLNHHVCCTGHPQSVAQNPEFISLFGTQVANALAVYAHHHDHRHNNAGEKIPLNSHSQSCSDQH